MIDEFISAFLQLFVFSLIPALVYIIKKKTLKGFFDYIGIKKSNMKANLWALLLVLLIAAPVLILSLISEDFHSIMTNPRSMIGKFKAMGVGAGTIILIILDAGIKTSLSEEIFFRGFVAKRLIAITNFQTGNIIQAIIFGLVHALLFLTITDNALFLTAIFVFPSLGAYFKVYLNEKLANGSILPGWIAHGTANLIAYGAGAFFI